MWPFGKKEKQPAASPLPSAFAFPIGPYTLDSRVDSYRGFVELSEYEYRAMPKQFRGEKIYKVPEVEFLGRRWKLMLGIVGDTIYKIAPYLEFDSRLHAQAVAEDLLVYCTSRLGPPTTSEPGLFLWDTLDGNVLLQMADVFGRYALNLFETSNAARTFQRVA